MLSPYNSGWSLEFRTFDPRGGSGMWQCVAGREGTFRTWEYSYAYRLLRTITVEKIPENLRLDDLPGDMDAESKGHLALGPGTTGVFCISAEDRRSLEVLSKPKPVLKLLEIAEDLVDAVFDRPKTQSFRPVAGPGAMWRLIFAVSP